MKKIYFAVFNFLSHLTSEGRNRFSMLLDPNIQFAVILEIMRILS